MLPLQPQQLHGIPPEQQEQQKLAVIHGFSQQTSKIAGVMLYIPTFKAAVYRLLAQPFSYKCDE